MSGKQKFHLPDGTFTTSADKYIKAWRKLAKPIEKATNSRAFGFDPGIAFERNGHIDVRYQTWNLPTDIAILLSEALKGNGK
jgi:hypothetical protein